MPRTTIVPLAISVQGVQLHSPFGVSHCVEHRSMIMAKVYIIVSKNGKTAGRADGHWLRTNVNSSTYGRLWRKFYVSQTVYSDAFVEPYLVGKHDANGKMKVE